MLPLLVLCALACTPSGVPIDPDSGDSSTPVDSDPPGETAPPEETAVPTPLPAVLLNELMADNDRAVEGPDGDHPDWIELYNAGDEPADLSGFALSDDWTDKDDSPLPEGTVIEAGGWLLLWADGVEEPGHLAFKLSADGEGVGLFAPDGTALDWISYPAQAEDYAWARLPDGCEPWEAVARGTPGEANARIVEESVALVERGAIWSYLDDGVYPGEGWTQVDFDDSGWASGPAPLGYGDDQPTQVSYGEDSGNKHITTWFRQRFTVAGGGSTSAASLELRVDDGAVVWLDGEALLRQGFADGEVGPETLASFTASGDAETAYTTYSVEPGLFTDGEHALAVEVHQASLSSSDLTVDLSLTLQTWVVVE